jgi:hypothetical protein
MLNNYNLEKAWENFLEKKNILLPNNKWRRLVTFEFLFNLFHSNLFCVIISAVKYYDKVLKQGEQLYKWQESMKSSLMCSLYFIVFYKLNKKNWSPKNPKKVVTEQSSF